MKPLFGHLTIKIGRFFKENRQTSEAFDIDQDLTQSESETTGMFRMGSFTSDYVF